MTNKMRLFLVLGMLLCAVYIGSYIGLSRRGYAEADQYHIPGFFYFSPVNSNAWRIKNYGCVCLFYPLNTIDRALGHGRGPASEPLWGLSK